MSAPKYIAASTCLIFVFLMFQGYMWHWRPEPGWQPSWWQSHTLATLGFLLSMPAMIPAVILANMGATNTTLGWLTIAFGYILEMGLTYILVYFSTRHLFKRIKGIRPAPSPN
jgi:hypothetical protein